MKPTILAFYLPQYYPFPENDKWWGKGFTEWTSVGRAKPLFKGHYQPKVPADLSYYDLRLPIVREQQAELAKQYGVDGFCYWHYWFGNGKRLLDLVENEVVASGKPDFPFCYCWANHSWASKNWNAKDSKFGHQTLMEQTYPGKQDYIDHFNVCLPAFKDSRYIKKGNKPVFGVFDATDIPNVPLFLSTWNELAMQNGFDGIHFFCYCMNVGRYEDSKNYPFDEFVVDTMNLAKGQESFIHQKFRRLLMLLNWEQILSLTLIPYQKYMDVSIDYFTKHPDVTACVLPNYDHSPRSGKLAVILTDSTPQLFGKMLSKIKSLYEQRTTNNNVLFVKAWNEWGEGNYLEPDLKYGRGYLEQILKVFGTKRLVKHENSKL